jgi:hypothetical protein
MSLATQSEKSHLYFLVFLHMFQGFHVLTPASLADWGFLLLSFGNPSINELPQV